MKYKSPWQSATGLLLRCKGYQLTLASPLVALFVSRKITSQYRNTPSAKLLILQLSFTVKIKLALTNAILQMQNKYSFNKKMSKMDLRKIMRVIGRNC